MTDEALVEMFSEFSKQENMFNVYIIVPIRMSLI